MTLRHYRIFIKVCDTMNMTAAAEALFMSQPAVSQAVAELEGYYKVCLFERLSRKLYLTQAGERLLSYGRHLIRMQEDIEAEMRQLGENGLIRLGASVTVGATMLPGLVSAYKEMHPRMDIEVFEDNTAHVEKRLLGDETDIGLVEGEINSPYIQNIPFLDDGLVLICGPRHRFASLPVVDPEELEKESFIIREKGSGTRKTFEDIMSARQLQWQASWTCNNADTIKAAVAQGLGVSVISRMAVEREVKAGELCAREIAGIKFDRKYKIAYHKNKYLTPAMEEFIRFCMEKDAFSQGRE